MNALEKELSPRSDQLAVLANRITQLPEMQKKIFQMYYFENMRLAEIAAVVGVTESRICQIHANTIIGLRAFIQRQKK